ncbi:MAG TPA: HEAT repeat domain-containing protein [Chthonomonadaceae bacterium]|nr:HEAT repeat domain-containing protein [Chthonomonadaceae bacterium]
MFGGYFWLFFLGPVTILAFIYIIVGALCEEGMAHVSRWWEGRRGLTDRKQSRYVRLCAQRLTSPKSQMRHEAAELLGELGDRSAVPALLRAMECYPTDVPFLLKVVQSLQQLGDMRAVPALRELTTGRHYGLMTAAWEAIEAIEPQSVLLRSASEPPGNREELLRPARHMGSSEACYLLRARNDR